MWEELVLGASDLRLFSEGVEFRMNEAQSLPNVLLGELLLAFGSQFFSSVNGNQNNSARLMWRLSQSKHVV